MVTLWVMAPGLGGGRPEAGEGGGGGSEGEGGEGGGGKGGGGKVVCSVAHETCEKSTSLLGTAAAEMHTLYRPMVGRVTATVPPEMVPPCELRRP